MSLQLAGGVLHGERPLAALLDRLRETSSLRAVSVLELIAEAEGRPGQAREERPGGCWPASATPQSAARA
ncbi:hypothetical protein ACH47V_25780 [Micromonospora chersina]|uniref:hypothetical protein n=1 Tax=Micromonospora chersina TaxID=47854 RepID=UPI0033DED473